MVYHLAEGSDPRILKPLDVKTNAECPNTHGIGKLDIGHGITRQKSIIKIDRWIFLARRLDHPWPGFAAPTACMARMRTVEDLQDIDARCRELHQEFLGQEVVLG